MHSYHMYLRYLWGYTHTWPYTTIHNHVQPYIYIYIYISSVAGVRVSLLSTQRCPQFQPVTCDSQAINDWLLSQSADPWLPGFGRSEVFRESWIWTNQGNTLKVMLGEVGCLGITVMLHRSVLVQWSEWTGTPCIYHVCMYMYCITKHMYNHPDMRTHRYIYIYTQFHGHSDSHYLLRSAWTLRIPSTQGWSYTCIYIYIYIYIF